MAPSKLLKGAAYDIAHHAQSGLSYVHPYIGDLCEAAETKEVMLSVLTSEPYPKGLDKIKPLQLSCMALKNKFYEILEKMGVEAGEVSELTLKFIYSSSRTDNYTCSVESTLTKANGIKYVQLVE